MYTHSYNYCFVISISFSNLGNLLTSNQIWFVPVSFGKLKLNLLKDILEPSPLVNLYNTNCFCLPLFWQFRSLNLVGLLFIIWSSQSFSSTALLTRQCNVDVNTRLLSLTVIPCYKTNHILPALAAPHPHPTPRRVKLFVALNCTRVWMFSCAPPMLT